MLMRLSITLICPQPVMSKPKTQDRPIIVPHLLFTVTHPTQSHTLGEKALPKLRNFLFLLKWLRCGSWGLSFLNTWRIVEENDANTHLETEQRQETERENPTHGAESQFLGSWGPGDASLGGIPTSRLPFFSAFCLSYYAMGFCHL